MAGGLGAPRATPIERPVKPIPNEEAKIQLFMNKLHCTREEAIDCIATDALIDKGGRTKYDLSPEQEKEAKKLANARTRKPTTYNFQKRERKPNATKSEIIADLFKYLQETANFSAENITVANKERQITFSYNGNNYELTLIQKRQKKE